MRDTSGQGQNLSLISFGDVGGDSVDVCHFATFLYSNYESATSKRSKVTDSGWNSTTHNFKVMSFATSFNGTSLIPAYLTLLSAVRGFYNPLNPDLYSDLYLIINGDCSLPHPPEYLQGLLTLGFWKEYNLRRCCLFWENFISSLLLSVQRYLQALTVQFKKTFSLACSSRTIQNWVSHAL